MTHSCNNFMGCVNPNAPSKNTKSTIPTVNHPAAPPTDPLAQPSIIRPIDPSLNTHGNPKTDNDPATSNLKSAFPPQPIPRN